ncbi:hypothetical protein C8Q72DRAFT_647456 [Fomitopsis betulina]|nr:hypothetical protein C8Q72DRAFT_647456 [Fomitopsis betulina]
MDSSPEPAPSLSGESLTTPPGTPTATQASRPSSPSLTDYPDSLIAGSERPVSPGASYTEEELSSATPNDAQPNKRPITPSGTVPPEVETVFSTPVNLKPSSRDPHSVQPTTGPDTRKAIRQRYDKEMRPNMVEMEFDTFLERYIPENGQPLPTTPAPAMSKEKLMGLEGDVCNELCKVAQDLFQRSNTAEKLAAKTTRNHPDDSDRNDYSESLKVDLCFYPADGVAKRDYSIRRSKGCSARTRWAWISLLAEVKTTHEQCAFNFEVKKKPDSKPDPESQEPKTPHPGNADKRQTRSKAKKGKKSKSKAKAAANGSDVPRETTTPTQGPAQEPKPFVRSGVGAEGSLGQMAEYVAKIFRRQHRTHLFTLFIFQGQARVIRWDRAGAIVSTVIDFEQQPSLLHEIIWRYAHMSQAQRGFDTTAVLASKEEVDAMRACEAPDQWIAERRDSALDQPGWPAYKLTMSINDLVDQRDLKPITTDFDFTPKPRETTSPASPERACYIVGRRHFTTNSPTGRGTKCYIAYDISHDRLVFLKDFWRPDVTSAQPEGAVLRELRSSGVQNVPTPLAAGDVRNSDSEEVQKTCTQALLGRDEKTQCRPATLIHYRLVVQEICRPLEDHESALTLTQVMLDALLAHEQAYTLKGYLHRDLSNNNILLWFYTDVNGNTHILGILNDWDLCKATQYLATVSRPGRSGTWQFMSAKLLRNPGKKHELADDLEAFVHVLCWETLRFYETSYTGHHNQLAHRIVYFFEACDMVRTDNDDIGGDYKYDAMMDGSNIVKLKASESPLGRLLQELTEICREHYEATEPKPTITGHSEVKHVNAHLRNSHKVVAKQYSRSTQTQSVVSAAAPKQAKLSSHAAILGAFGRAVSAGIEEWRALVKTEDQFERPQYKSALMQRTLERSTVSKQISAGSKRALEEEEGRPDRSKRARGATQSAVSELEVVGEE